MEMTKRELAEIMFGEAVPKDHVWGKCKTADHNLNTLLMSVFKTEVGLTELGASTYIRGCKRVASGLPFYHGTAAGPRDTTPEDKSPDVEDTRPLYTVVNPRDDLASKRVVVDSTHSFYDLMAALKAASFDAIVVLGLPDLESDFLKLTPITVE